LAHLSSSVEANNFIKPVGIIESTDHHHFAVNKVQENFYRMKGHKGKRKSSTFSAEQISFYSLENWQNISENIATTISNFGGLKFIHKCKSIDYFSKEYIL